MKKFLFILAILTIGFQYSFSQDIENKNDTIWVKKGDVRAVIPDIRAGFKGGDKALSSFLSSVITYPKMAMNNGVEHKFFVNFIICPDGSVCNIEIRNAKKLDEKQETETYQESVALLEKEAIRVVQETNGKWNAGIKDGEKVNSYFTIPIIFKLKDKTSSQNIKNKKDIAVVVPDVKAEFKGGDNALISFLSSELTYPYVAANNGVERTVCVNFVICQDGSVCNIMIGDAKKLDKKEETETYKKFVASLEKEAIRVVQETNGKWNAGIKDGEKVNCYFTMPVTFKIVHKVHSQYFQYIENDFSQYIANNNDSIQALPDVKAEFIGGDEELMNFISSKIKYPTLAKKEYAQRKILISFIIFKDGKIGDIKIKKNTKADKILIEDNTYIKAVKLLENEAIRLVKLTNGKWTPGKKDKENVDVCFTIPFTFVLKYSTLAS